MTLETVRDSLKCISNSLEQNKLNWALKKSIQFDKKKKKEKGTYYYPQGGYSASVFDLRLWRSAYNNHRENM